MYHSPCWIMALEMGPVQNKNQDQDQDPVYSTGKASYNPGGIKQDYKMLISQSYAQMGPGTGGGTFLLWTKPVSMKGIYL